MNELLVTILNPSHGSTKFISKPNDLSIDMNATKLIYVLVVSMGHTLLTIGVNNFFIKLKRVEIS